MSETGFVFDLKRGSVKDGPGFRTAVFLKGCPLRCLWCHNPESQYPLPELCFHPAKCSGCGACFAICHAHRMVNGVHELNRSECKHCGHCATVCPTGALEMAGRRMTVDEVMEEVVADLPFYRHSGGGITLTGGEPTAQFDFCKSLLRAARAAGIHTALDYLRFSVMGASG